MKMIALGSGSAFTVGTDNFQSNFLIEDDNGRRLLVDCGGDIRHSLHRVGLGALNIDAVYISHLHFDHVGGLEWLGLNTLFNPEAQRPELFLAEDLVDPLWQTVLAGSMGAIPHQPAGLDTYFDVHAIPPKGSFRFGAARIELFAVEHVYEGDVPAPCYGLMITVDDVVTMFTADSQFTPDRLFPLYDKADRILHDCETCHPPSGVHAHWQQLCSLPREVRAKTWLYHYHPRDLPDARAAGFRGFIRRGQSFDLARAPIIL